MQARPRIWIGGNGEKRKLRIAARHADGWNTSGTLEEVKGALDALARACDDAGRDLSEIELTVSFPTIIRDTVEAAQEVRAKQLAHNGIHREPIKACLPRYVAL